MLIKNQEDGTLNIPMILCKQLDMACLSKTSMSSGQWIYACDQSSVKQKHSTYLFNIYRVFKLSLINSSSYPKGHIKVNLSDQTS
jgi:hypothetical protein